MSDNPTNKRSGPWDVPIRDFVKECKIKVSVLDVKDDDKVIHEVVLEYGNYDDRKFLGKITYWAITNGYVVETAAA